MNKKFRIDIAVLRLIAVITVVFFHIYGMCYASSHLPSPLPQIYRETYWRFNQFIPINVAMPLFVFISGYLFSIQIKSGKYSSISQLLKDKFLRLILPSFVFSILMMLSIHTLDFSFFIKWGYAHLWFLPMLFWLFIISYITREIWMSGVKCYELGFLLLTFIILLVKPPLPIVGRINLTVENLYFFVLGTELACNEQKVITFFEKNKLFVFFMFALYLILGVIYPTEYGEITLRFAISSTAAVLILFYVCNIIAWDKVVITPFLIRISSYSFGLYVFHFWVAPFMISTTAKRYFPFIVDFASSHIILFPLVFSVSVIIICILITESLCRTKIGRILIK